MNDADLPALPLQWIFGGLTAILLSGIAITSLAISPEINRRPETPDAPKVAARGESEPAASATRNRRCSECGTVESTRKAEPAPDATLAVVFETTVRMQDGSSRLITDADPVRWKRGERVIIMAGITL